MKKIVIVIMITFSNFIFAEPLEDNSFLVEEAYNQEPGVVQFINVYQKSTKTKDWSYVFINEIQMINQNHQFSYEIPYSYSELNDENAIQDIKLNYRYEFLRNEILTTTGRLSATLGNADYKKGYGSGAVGYEVSLISSIKINEKWTQHWNIGGAITPDAKNSIGDQAENSKYFWNLSNIYFVTDMLNLMLEISTSEEESTIGKDQSEWAHNTTISPSIRYGIDVSDWQFVPGLAFPTSIGPNAGTDNQVLGYLSIEGKVW